MGVLPDAEKYVRSEVKEIGREIGAAVEHAREFVREAARSKDLTIPTVTIYIQEDIKLGKLLEKELSEDIKAGKKLVEKGLNPIDARTGQITGVYVPPSVKADAKVDVILYMHGDKVRVWNQHGTIRDYWNLPQLPLRQGLSASGKPFILVAPTLGVKAGAEFGDLGTNIDDHLDHVMAQLHKFGPPQFAPPKPPEIGQLIIAGHSGAYGPISSILSNIKKYKANVTEIWGFDIMYTDMLPSFAKFKVPVYVYFVKNPDRKKHNTDERSRDLARKKIPNIFVMENVDFAMVRGKEQKSWIEHDNLLQRFWPDRCRRIGTNGSNSDDRKRMVNG
jgi:hypothetical protein